MSRTSHQRLLTTSILTQNTNIQPQGPSGLGARALRALPGERARTRREPYPTVDEGLYARVEAVRSREDADALLRRWGAYEIDVNNKSMVSP